MLECIVLRHLHSIDRQRGLIPLGDCTICLSYPAEQTDTPERVTTPPPVLPPATAADSGATATVVAGSVGGSGTSIKRRHSRGRSITSRAEMMSSSRPGSAKARAEGPGPTPWSEPTQPTSPPTHDTHMREGHVSWHRVYVYSIKH